MEIPLVDLRTQYLSIKSEIDQAIQTVFDHSVFSGGPFVEKFEQAFARAHQAKYCVGCSSGTAALHLVLMALEIGPDDEVIVPTNTFFATAEAVSLCGAKPVFVDCEPSFYNIDPIQTQNAITSKTKAIIAVHLYGQPAALDEIGAIAKASDVTLIEDCAQAHLALYKGRPVGTFGIAGCFSFYPGKNLGAYGEGGAVTTNDQTLWRKVTALRNHGSIEKYVHNYVGQNYRLDALQGAILDVKLKYLKDWTHRRRKVASYYRECLADIAEVVVPEEAPEGGHVYHLFVVRARERDRLMAHLQNVQIATGIHYPIPCHLQRPYAKGDHGTGSCTVSEQYSCQILSLPIFPELTQKEVQYVSEQIRAFYQA